MRREGKREKKTDAFHDRLQILDIHFGRTATGVHLVDLYGDHRRAELLDEEMGEEVVVAREVLHVHDLGEPPCWRGGGGGRTRV